MGQRKHDITYWPEAIRAGVKLRTRARVREITLVLSVLDLAVDLRIDGSVMTEMHRDHETKCREEVRGEAQR